MIINGFVSSKKLWFTSVALFASMFPVVVGHCLGMNLFANATSFSSVVSNRPLRCRTLIRTRRIVGFILLISNIPFTSVMSVLMTWFAVSVMLCVKSFPMSTWHRVNKPICCVVGVGTCMFSFTLYRFPFTSVGLMLFRPKGLFGSVYSHSDGLFMNWLCTVGVIPFMLSCIGCMSDIFTACFSILNI